MDAAPADVLTHGVSALDSEQELRVTLDGCIADEEMRGGRMNVAQCLFQARTPPDSFSSDVSYGLVYDADR
jgi:hypothetical protein